VNVAFAGRRRRFTAGEIDAFELLTQSVAPGVVGAGSAVPSLAGLLRERTGRGSPGEHEVLRLLADGLSDREVAARLVISPKTVEKHVGAVLRKTGTTSRTAAVMYGLDHGWIASDDLQNDDSTDR
jgi:DNA-binding NarL/FixJ family response regulator